MKLLVVLTGLWSSILAAQTISNPNQNPNERTATVGRAVVRWEQPWTPSAMQYKNAMELVVKAPAGHNDARVLVTTEPRTSPADAVERLSEIAATYKETARFLDIGGWPAVEVIFTEMLPRRGQERQNEREPMSPPQKH